jgi:tryptophanyl-tRNA synthetase
MQLFNFAEEFQFHCSLTGTGNCGTFFMDLIKLDNTYNEEIMKDKIVLSGMRPTGALHLGNYAGALKSWLELQNKYPCYFFIADWHSLTTDYQDPSKIRTYNREVLLDWLSAGIDPEKSVIYVQSAIKEVSELFLILSMITPLGWLERVPTFKEQQQQLNEKDLSTFGFLGYPLLQTVDIIIVRGNLVPVGEDQVFHIELAREIVRRFNNFYGEFFVEPQEFLTPNPRLPGLDGRKMSKSYGNAIYLSDSAKTVDQKIRPMVTDTRRMRRTDPGVPADCPVFSFHQSFSSVEERAEITAGCTQATIGCIDCKKILIKNINQFLEPLRERRLHYQNTDLDGLLEKGNQQARSAAKATMDQVRRMIQI